MWPRVDAPATAINAALYRELPILRLGGRGYLYSYDAGTGKETPTCMARN